MDLEGQDKDSEALLKLMERMQKSGVSPSLMKKLLKLDGIKSDSSHETFINKYQEKIDALHKE